MTRITSDDYQQMLENAGDDMENEAQANIMAELIEQRLNALGVQNPGELDMAVAMAAEPKTRPDGQIIGMAEYKSKPLTKAQYQFAQYVIEGHTRRQAYRLAYPNAKGSDGTISACAHKLCKDPRIDRMIKSGWEETTDTLSEDIAATKRYVMRSLVALSKAGKQEGSRLKALELLGRHAGMWQQQQSQPEQTLTAEQLRRELAVHLRLVSGKKGGG